MANLSDFNDRPLDEDLQDFDNESICSRCYATSQGFYSRERKALFYICTKDYTHQEKVEFTYE